MLSLYILWLGYAAASAGAMVSVVGGVLRPHTVARMTFTAALLVLSLETLFATLATQSTSESSLALWLGMRFGMTSLVVPCWMLFSFCYGRGDQHEVLRRRKWIVVAAFAISFLLMASLRSAFVTAVSRGNLDEAFVLYLGRGSTVLHLFVLAGSVIVLLALEQTFRASVGVMRWRMKFVALAIGVVFLSRIYTTSQALIYRQWWSSQDSIQALTLLAACMLIGISMARSSLSAVEVYPSRKIISGSITVALVGLYLVGVGLVSWLTHAVLGPGAVVVQALAALLGAVLLAVILLSDRIRHHFSLFVSRNLHRPTHDYRAVWQNFAQRTASRVTEDDFCRSAVDITSETFQAGSVTLWVIGADGNPGFGASTHLSRERAEDLWQQAHPPGDWVEGLQGCSRTLVLQKVDAPWIAGLKRFVSLQHQGMLGDTLCVSLHSATHLVGLMLVGNRVNHASFSTEDLDLLDTIAMEIGRGLLALRLADKLVNTRETEALRNMSAFMAHDLKNTASSLSLTLQNLRTHFDNPDFREDALKAVKHSVLHLNELNSGLSVLREGLQVQPVAGDLNVLVEETIAEMQGGLAVELHRSLQPLPLVAMDAPQIKTVLVNLLLNARDALTAGGTIEIRTQHIDQWAQLSVADNGCGMTVDFVRQSLFRPFQTTKKQGLGIGMFQSRLIVESHQGWIHVESAPESGTTFRIVLPLAAQSL